MNSHYGDLDTSDACSDKIQFQLQKKVMGITDRGHFFALGTGDFNLSILFVF